MEDYEILRKAWEGGIPVEFKLDKEEIGSKNDLSYYGMLPRTSYFYLELDNALKFFANATDNLGDLTDVWLESHGTILKWHYPIGVLFDLHSCVENLPWTVTIHLKKFPDDLIRFSKKEEKRNCFLQAIKEADQLKNRGKIVNEMQPHEHTRLFDSLCNKKFDEFRTVNNKLRIVDNALFLPIRFYKVGNKSFQQILIKPHNEDSTELSINDAVKCAFPDENLEKLEFLTHGISIPTTTPLSWLTRNLAYADNFVHIVLKEI